VIFWKLPNISQKVNIVDLFEIYLFLSKKLFRK